MDAGWCGCAALSNVSHNSGSDWTFSVFRGRSPCASADDAKRTIHSAKRSCASVAGTIAAGEVAATCASP